MMPLKLGCITLVMAAGLLLSLQAPAAASEQVEIYRDSHGVAHVFGPSDAAVCFGHGYAQAQDHLHLMLEQIFTLTGRGYQANPAILQNLFQDALVAALESNKIAREKYHTIPEHHREMIEAFCDGVNLYMREYPERVPAWFQEAGISPYDIVGYAQIFTISSQIPFILDKLPEGVLPINIDLSQAMSNQWALAPSRVSTGNAIVQMDPHLDLQLPYLWYEAHLVSPNFDVKGVTTIGIPIIIMGQNEHMAWSMTDNSVDNCDVLRIYVDKTNPSHYLWDGQSYPFDIQTTFIQTRTGELPFSYGRTHFGPIIDKINPIGGGEAITFSDLNYVHVARFTMAGQLGTIEQVYDMIRSRNVREFKQALSKRQIEKWNFVFADVEGNISYVHNSRHPIRNLDENASLSDVIDSRDPSKVWQDEDIVPFEDLLQMDNPPKGYLSNCNSTPYMTNAHYGFDETSFPEHYIGIPEMNYRGTRALSFFDNNTVYTPEELRELSMDSVISHAGQVVGLARTNFEHYKATLPAYKVPQIEGLLASLEAWDKTCHRDSVGIANWAVFTERSLNRRRNWVNFPPEHEADEVLDRNLGLALVNDLNMTYREVMRRWSRLDKPWHEVSGIFYGGKFFGSSGYRSSQTLRVKQGPYNTAGRRYHATFGSSYTAFVELSKPPRMWSMNPFGINRDPSSPHFTDLTELYSKDTYKWMPNTRTEIEDGNHTLLSLEYPPIMPPRVGVDLKARFGTDRRLTVELRAYNDGPDVPVALYVAVEIAGTFYFHPAFTTDVVALAELSLPQIDTGWFELWSAEINPPIGRNIPAVWYSALLNTASGNLIGTLKTSEVVLN